MDDANDELLIRLLLANGLEECDDAVARIQTLKAERDRFAERHERHLILGAEVRARAEKAEAARDAALEEAAVSRVVKQNDPFAGVGIIPPPGPHVNFAETPAHIAALQKEAWEKSHGKKADDLVYRLAAALRDAFATANARIEHLEKLDREAATYVESVIAMRTHFTGNPPYVGWKGLGLALNEALDERDAARNAALEEAAKVAESPDLLAFKRGWSTSQDAAALFIMMTAAAAIRALKGKSHE